MGDWVAVGRECLVEGQMAGFGGGEGERVGR